MKKEINKLDAIRIKIDQIDEQIQSLINQRAALAIEVGKIKRTEGEQIFYRPEREAKILQQIIKRNPGPLSAQHVTSIFRPLLTACLTLQHPIKVAYLGPEGTYSQAAVFQHFGSDTHTIEANNIPKIFRAIEAGDADYGVVPIENSSTGMINATLDELVLSALIICGEVILPIHHHLLRQLKAHKEIKRVFGHEQSLMQCQHWLDAHLPKVERIAVASNGAGAVLAAKDKYAAAIAGELAASKYKLAMTHKNIEDNPQNKTRFLVLGKQKVTATGNDKTSLLISTPHKPGALIKLITPFADNNINISLIESRPSQSRDWAYLFFLDIDGHRDDVAVTQALELLAKQSILLSVLGSYPKALI